MKVEFYDPEDEQKVTVATAGWDGSDVTVTAADETIRTALAHAFRRSAVAVDDASLRRLGTSGDVVIQPGSLEWFRAAANTRATAESGLAARFVPGLDAGGFDPAAGYRRFDEQLERLDARTR
jgi:putative intracellular protease/amidase